MLSLSLSFSLSLYIYMLYIYICRCIYTHTYTLPCGSQALIATLFLDRSMSARPVIVNQNSPSVSNSFL